MLVDPPLSLFSFLIFRLFVGASSFVKFEETPLNSVAYPGDTVYFNCKTNISDDEIRWLHGGSPIPLDSPSFVTSKNYLSFRVGKVPESYSKQIGEYQCLGGGGLVASIPARLSIAELKNFSTPGRLRSIEAYEGNDAAIDCNVPYSNPPGFVQYYRNGTPLIVEDSSKELEILNGEILLLKNIALGLSDGNYTCYVQNHITGEKKKSKSVSTLKILPLAGRAKSRLIHRPKEDYSVNQGDNITIPCIASGNPKPEIFWSRFGESTDIIPSEHGILRIQNAKKSDAGSYMCAIYNGARRFVRKTKLTVRTPPTFIESPASLHVLVEGSELTLICKGEGIPEPKVTWYHNGAPINNQSHTLHIHSARKKDSGLYQCLLTNIVGGNYSIMFVRVTENDYDDEDYEDYSYYDVNDVPTLVPPSKPNITQLSLDSVMISWNITNNTGLPISFFKIQFREFRGKKRSDWRTLDDVIEPDQRNFEILGLHSERKYRFRIVAVYENNDNKPGPLSKKFKFNKRLKDRRLKISPVITKVLQMGETSLRVGWKIRSLVDVEGYFIYYRPSLSAGRPFKKITIIGGSSHSYVIEDLQPGLRYEIRVQAFNFRGVSPLSRVKRISTPTRRESTTETSLKEGKKPDESTTLMDDQVRFYLLIGGALALVVLLVIICCSLVSYIQKRKALKSFSASNVAIHEKYMDASLAQYRSAANIRQVGNLDSAHSSMHAIHGTCETSFSNKACSTTNSSSASVINNRNPSDQEKEETVGYEEYTAEPSGTSWRRKRRSEELL